MAKDSSPPETSGHHRYLPLLSLLLAILSGTLVLRLYLKLPSDKHEKRVAAFDAALRSISQHYAGEVDETELYRAAMRGMVDRLDDPYSAFLSGFELQNADAQTQGQFGGIGVMVSRRDGEALLVEVQQDSPAREAGLEPGDSIVAVNGVKVSEMSFVEMVAHIRGKVGTSVELTVEKAETENKVSVSLERKLILMESVTWRYVEDGIAQIKINRFDSRALQGVRNAISELQQEKTLRALILDVRGNVGGLLETATGICDLFLTEGPIVKVVSKKPDEKKIYRAHRETAVSPQLPIVMLTDGRSASASEVMAGALQNRERATVIGATTFGKGAVNRIFPLPDRTGIFLTVAHYKVGNGQDIEGKGVQPDIAVGEIGPPPEDKGPAARREWLKNYRDAATIQLEKAVEYLREKLEGNSP